MENKLFVSSSPHIRSKSTTQIIMRDVVIALTPAALYGVYVFGIRAAIVLLLSIFSAVATEVVCQKLRKQNITINDFSAVVTGLLLGMNLSSAVPFWIPIIGSIFAIAVVKQLFGGLGHNFMNPALAARVFLVGSWGQQMNTWYAPNLYDAVTAPTPLALLKGGEQVPDLFATFMGNVGGCIGETSAIFLLLGGLYLIYRGVISYVIPVGYIATTAILTFFLKGFDFHTTMLYVFSGGLIIGAFFMATDYVSSPITPKGKWIYAIGMGVLTTLIRVYGGYPEGVSYTILIFNVASPLIDRFTKPKVFGTGGVK